MFKNSIFAKIPNEILNSFSEELKNEDLLALHSIFENTAIRALELLDKATFTLYTTENRLRSIIQVNNFSKQLYTVFPDINYCNCPAFKYQVLISGQELTCKHILGAKLAVITKCIKEVSITSSQLKELLQIVINID